LQHSPVQAKSFAESLPKAYLAAFDWAAISEHANIAAHRVTGHSAVGTCSAPRLPGTALCIIADDRPGLLATISAALVSERLDVIAAEAYTRKTPEGRREAVDVFWIRRLDQPETSHALHAEELRHLETVLDALLVEPLGPKSVHIPTRPPPPQAGGRETTVRFIENRGGMLSTLEVETYDRTGMLLVLSRALYEQHVQIVSSLVRTKANRIHDRFEVTELDDSAISPERRLSLQVAILNAVQETFG
jgi:[protein-PII] uridylyltransferase